MCADVCVCFDDQSIFICEMSVRVCVCMHGLFVYIYLCVCADVSMYVGEHTCMDE